MKASEFRHRLYESKTITVSFIHKSDSSLSFHKQIQGYGDEVIKQANFHLSQTKDPREFDVLFDNGSYRNFVKSCGRKTITNDACTPFFRLACPRTDKSVQKSDFRADNSIKGGMQEPKEKETKAEGSSYERRTCSSYFPVLKITGLNETEDGYALELENPGKGNWTLERLGYNHYLIQDGENEAYFHLVDYRDEKGKERLDVIVVYVPICQESQVYKKTGDVKDASSLLNSTLKQAVKR